MSIQFDLKSSTKTSDGRGYNYKPETFKAKKIGVMLKLIARDRNWSRALFNLPLVDPVDPRIRRFLDIECRGARR